MLRLSKLYIYIKYLVFFFLGGINFIETEHWTSNCYVFRLWIFVLHEKFAQRLQFVV